MTDRNENKPGYRKTPAGWIPEEWGIVRLGSVFSLSSGNTKPRDTKPSVNGNVCVQVIGGNGLLGYSASKMFDTETIVIGRVGEKCGCVHHIKGPQWITDNALFVERWEQRVAVRFFYYLLMNLNLSRLRNKGGQPLVSQSLIYPLQVPLPPLPEQKKIAEILSAWDEAIEQTRALIAAAKRRKKALMQQLLTGKTRLPGFVDRPGKIERLRNMVRERTERWRNGKTLPVLSVTNDQGFIPQEEQFDRRVASDDLANYKIVRRGNFAYNPSRVNVGSIDMLKYVDAGLLSPMYVVFQTDTSRLLPEYLRQVCGMYSFSEQVRHLTQGSVRDSLGFDGLCAIKAFVPEIPEQRAIAAVLGTSDEEIKSLETQCAALERQKKGLMQKLLTGEVRVRV